MNKKEFLKQCDPNILSLEFDEAMFEDGKIEKTVLIDIGLSKKEEDEYLKSLTEDQIKNSKVHLQQFEIMITKSDLEFMLNELNNY